MKKISLTDILSCAFFLIFLSTASFAQVGIGTVTPDGVLDLNSDTGTNTYGLVLPRVALVKTDQAAPVINASDGSSNLAVGTVVYNTVTTNTGLNDVYPGIYMWDGDDWIHEFPKRDAQIFKQSPSDSFRPVTTGSYEDIPNLGSPSFTPTYSGTYKIEVSMNYGGGYSEITAGGVDVVVQKGKFRFIFNSVTEFDNEVNTWSARHGSGTRYYDIWEQSTIIIYKELVSGTSYSFNLSFDQTLSDGIEDNGDNPSGNPDWQADGRGWIGGDIPCTVEFVFLD
ncbi:MAG: hypothetical protein KUG68_11155 [Flavobacteriaceae bacterium]|nr:hypothetical protein [Flavobacteriaceae bacterium]